MFILGIFTRNTSFALFLIASQIFPPLLYRGVKFQEILCDMGAAVPHPISKRIIKVPFSHKPVRFLNLAMKVCLFSFLFLFSLGILEFIWALPSFARFVGTRGFLSAVSVLSLSLILFFLSLWVKLKKISKWEKQKAVKVVKAARKEVYLLAILSVVLMAMLWLVDFLKF
jgi:hypothetical protein